MRTFIAIELPEDIKSKIFHASETLTNKNFFRGKFVEKKDLHLTLKFLGEMPEEKVDEIKKKLKEIKFEKFFGEIKSSGIFPDEKKGNIKIVWVDLISDKLNEFQSKIVEKFPEISSDLRKFAPHITIVRVESAINKRRMIEEIEKIHFKNLKFEIKEFVLMKSEAMAVKTEGSKYKVIERYKLGAKI